MEFFPIYLMSGGRYIPIAMYCEIFDSGSVRINDHCIVFTMHQDMVVNDYLGISITVLMAILYMLTKRKRTFV